VRRSVQIFGAMALALVILAFTRVPFDVHRWLGTAGTSCTATTTELIIVLGGSGMPSGPELLRLHRTAQLAVEHPAVPVMVVHPAGGDVMADMIEELVLRGVARSRIRPLLQGNNTREQALACAQTLGPGPVPVVLVTAPENIYRSVRAFRKAGLTNVCGAPAWDHAMAHDFRYRHREVGGKAYLPDVSEAPGLRYTFWNYLKLEFTCIREFVAIGYYRMNGWI
jgi:uncharacterized SAM-binding protein YcdF (DUF218 family)